MRTHEAVGLGLSLVVALVAHPRTGAGEPGREEIEKLVAKLGSDAFQERTEAYQRLIIVGKPALERLREAVKSDDLEVSRRAANLVKEIETVWRPDYVDEQRKELGRKEFSLAEVLDACGDERPYVRRSAIPLLFKWRKEPEVATALLLLLRDPDVRVRRGAATTAGCCLSNEEIVRALLIALMDEDEGGHIEGGSVSANAASSLAAMAQPTQEVKAALLEATKSSNDWLRSVALVKVGQLASKDPSYAPKVVEALRAALRGKDCVKEMVDVGLRSNAAAGLRMLKSDAKSAVPDLITALSAEGVEDAQTARTIRTNVMHALEAIGPDAAAAVPHLLSIVKREGSSREERSLAVRALERIDPNLKLPVLPDR